MSRTVDAVARRRELAEAVWRVIRRDGLDQASVRNVAREAALSAGSLRHYFTSQSELLAFALRTVIERIEARILAVDGVADPRLRAERVLDQLLPMDDERGAENEIWLAFTARALVDSELRSLRNESHDNLRAGCRALVIGLRAANPGLDVDGETDRLHALLDGLAVHAASRPEETTPQRMRAVLARHLDELERVSG
ncbi:TetR family transcriptional regulator C-terminal domain-containing protein [Saccharomonospora sp. NPDC006951]